MNETETETPADSLELVYDLDAPPQKVWRALSIPAFRERWLPTAALADPQAAALTPEREARYRMRDSEPPFLESVVTFQISANASGGTRLRIIHELVDARVTQATMTAANGNSPPRRRAA
jgi:uncharacterized protein YndB with AHSA1/START domain